MKKLDTAIGYGLTATSIVACPCHLPFTLPLVLGLLGGTAFGAALGANTWIVFAGATLYFVVALGAGLYLLNRSAGEEKADTSRRRGELSKGVARNE